MEVVERTEGMDTETLTDIVGRYQAVTVQVQYQDVANPLRVGTVVEHRAGEFRVCWDDAEGGETWSDLRQAGWALATPGSLVLTNTEYLALVRADRDAEHAHGEALRAGNAQAAALTATAWSKARAAMVAAQKARLG